MLSRILSMVLIVSIMSPVQTIHAKEIDKVEAADGGGAVSGGSSSSSSSSSSSGNGETASSSTEPGSVRDFNSTLHSESSCESICSTHRRWKSYVKSDAACMKNIECSACVDRAITSSTLRLPCEAMDYARKGRTWQAVLVVLFGAVTAVCAAGCFPWPGAGFAKTACRIGQPIAAGFDLLAMIMLNKDFMEALPTYGMGFMAGKAVGTAIESNVIKFTGKTADQKRSCKAASMFGVVTAAKVFSLTSMNGTKQQECQNIKTAYAMSSLGGFTSINDCRNLTGMSSSSGSGECANPYDESCNGNTYDESDSNWLKQDWPSFVNDTFENSALLADIGLGGLDADTLGALKADLLSAPQMGIDVDKIRAMAANGASAQDIMNAGIHNAKAVNLEGQSALKNLMNEAQQKFSENPGLLGSVGKMTTGGGAVAAKTSGDDFNMAAMMEKLIGGGNKEEMKTGVQAIGFSGGRAPASSDIFHKGSKESIFQIVSSRIVQSKDAVDALPPALPMNRALAK